MDAAVPPGAQTVVKNGKRYRGCRRWKPDTRMDSSAPDTSGMSVMHGCLRLDRFRTDGPIKFHSLSVESLG